MAFRPRPVALIVLDGWGLASGPDADATKLAETVVMRRLCERYPIARLEAAGEAVGLPEGVIGNSEVGHLNLGAGRVIYQSLVRVNRAIADESFFVNAALRGVMRAVRERSARLHLVGLVSDAGVHSHLDHAVALCEMARREKVDRVYLHALTDGRDSDPHAGAGYLKQFAMRTQEIGCGEIASVVGRYFTMDRDQRWERTQRGYDAMVRGDAPLVDDAIAAVERSYAEGKTDEFIEPFCVRGKNGAALATVASGDGVIFFNFRADRARQLTRALTQPTFDGFARQDPRPEIAFASMTQYDETFDVPVAFPPEPMTELLADVVAGQGLTQLRLAETEKYAHVTYFFNGGDEALRDGEERIMVPSRRDVATYDLVPEMCAAEITDEALKRLRGGPVPDLLVLNYANADMVGHTGKLDATCHAVEAVDKSLGRLLEEIQARGGVAIVTADHGNAEMMVHPVTGAPHTAHTLNPVPVILVDDTRRDAKLRVGRLADVAPTILELMGIALPAQMNGRSLLAR